MRTSVNYISKIMLAVAVMCILLTCCFLAAAQENAKIAYADTSAFEFYQGKYDTYTNSDSFNYRNSTYTIGDYHENSTLSTGNVTISPNSSVSGGYTVSVSGDNAITQIVPKELFQNNGDYTYIGKEYGFYVHTADYAPFGNKQSIVMVFDIATVNTGLDTNAGVVEIKVEPLFQRKYVYLSPNNDQYRFDNRADGEPTQYINYNIAGEGYVVPSVNLVYDDFTHIIGCRFVGEVQEYYLKDVSYFMMLLNEQDPNEGNGGVHYDPYKDTGSYFTYFDYKYDGTARRHGEFPQEEHDAFASEIFNVFLSACEMIPVAGKAVEVVNLGLKIAGQVGMGIDFAVGLDNWLSEEDVDVSNGKVTATNYYTNRDDQIEAYGKIVKAVGTIINSTDEGESIWYKTGDHATGYFQIGHSALNNQHKNLTRLVRQIGVKVVNTNGEEVDAAVGSYNYMLREPQYKSIGLEEEKYLYLLDDGTNYFMFSPQYTSDYRFIFETAENISLNINGTKHDGQTENNKKVFNVRLSGGADYNIIVENHSGCLMAPFHVETFAEMSGIELGTDEYIVKISGNGMKRINVNGGAQIKAVKELDAAGQLVNSSAVSNNLATSSLDIMLDGEYYLILQNDKATSASFTYASVPVIGLEENDTNEQSISFTHGGGMKYVQFKTTGNGTKGYVFSLSDTYNSGIDVGTNYRVYKSDGTQIGNMYPLEIGSYYVSLPAGEYYIGFYANVEVKALLNVQASDVAFRWQVEYIGANSTKENVPVIINQTTLIDSITLPLLPSQGHYKFTLWINDTIAVQNYYFNLSDKDKDTVQTNVSGDVYIDTKCELGTAFRIEGTVPDNVHATFKHRIDVTVKLVMDEFAFNETVDYKNAMTFSWKKQPIVQGYKFAIYYGAKDPIIKTVENTATTKLDILSSLLTKYPTSAYVQLDQVKVNGNYVSIKETNKIEFDGKNRLDLNCMYSRIETKKVLLIFTVKHYYVANELQLYNIRNDQSYARYLDNDITLSKAWTPIPELTCAIYGNGHKIKNLSFYIGSGSPTPRNVGFVGINKSTISNLVIDGISLDSAQGQHFEPWYYIGGIAGQNESIIISCKVTGSMSAHRAYSTLGGIAGKNSGTISGCYFGLLGNTRSYLYGNGDVGGIAGENSGTITGSYVENTDIRHYAVHASHSAGGIAGYCPGGSILSSAVHNINISNANPDPVQNVTIAPKMGMIVGHIENGIIQTVGMSGSTYGYGGLTNKTRFNCFNGGWPFYGLMSNTQVDSNMNQNGP